MDLKSYAEVAGKAYDNLYKKLRAFEVLSVCHMANDAAKESWRNLAEIHSAPEWLWPAPAELVGKVYRTLYGKVMAFKVLSVLDIQNEDAKNSWSQLAAIHSSPEWEEILSSRRVDRIFTRAKCPRGHFAQP